MRGIFALIILLSPLTCKHYLVEVDSEAEKNQEKGSDYRGTIYIFNHIMYRALSLVQIHLYTVLSLVEIHRNTVLLNHKDTAQGAHGAFHHTELFSRICQID